MFGKYQPLVDYLGRQTPWRFELDLSPTYQETVARLCDGRTQLAYVGPYTYLRAADACGARPIVRLNTARRATYRSYIMVREDSAFRTLKDLRGKTIAFGARLSTSAHLMPRGMLIDAGVRPGIDIGCRFYGHHDQAARAVLIGEVAAAGIRDLTGDRFKTRGLRVLAVSPAIPNFPFIVKPETPSAVVDALVKAFVDTPGRDPAVKEMMASWDAELADGFSLVSAEEYRPVELLAARVFGPRAMRIDPSELGCGGVGGVSSGH
jgi:phosphonate transport system substrate-binding protein